jgi:hypothetical protein
LRKLMELPEKPRRKIGFHREEENNSIW